MAENAVQKASVPPAKCADDAVGMDSLHWFIAIVGNNAERKYAKKLAELGYETFVPVQQVAKLSKAGKRHTIEKVLLHSIVFVRANEQDRIKKLAYMPYINRFMVDPARRHSAISPVAVIPDEQMSAFRFMTDNAESPVSVSSYEFHSGDKVRVVKGQLAGLEGMVQRTPEGKTQLYISLDILGYAFVEINKTYLQRI